jgi:site-specific DNA-methyltransferase (adenine-specific)
MTYQILHGNNLDILPTLADNSIDSIVTDPPYELGFMGKKWDSSGIAYSVELWQQCLRVLKPGGHLLSFGGTRTYHRVAVAIEDAGFELRDSIAWLYGSGFPKSLDISKAIDKAAGAKREVIGQKPDYLQKRGAEIRREQNGGVSGLTKSNRERGGDFYKTDAAAGYTNTLEGSYITAPSTPEAQQWQGWGTALKPAFEPVIVARKPIEGTVANNVLKWGTGGLNIDGSRIGSQGGTQKANLQPESKSQNAYGNGLNGGGVEPINAGRWPANIILDPYTAELLDEQSGDSKSQVTNFKVKGRSGGILGKEGKDRDYTSGFSDTGGASRFFYVAKASKRDRNEGLEELEEQRHSDRELADGVGGDNPRNRTNQAKQNFHPTVKPTSLMEYLIKLVTPPQGTVLDPFTGSGSTGKAAILQGFDFIGIEMTKEYLPIIEGRLKHAEAKVAKRIKETINQQSEVLF